MSKNHAIFLIEAEKCKVIFNSKLTRYQVKKVTIVIVIIFILIHKSNTLLFSKKNNNCLIYFNAKTRFDRKSK